MKDYFEVSASPAPSFWNAAEGAWTIRRPTRCLPLGCTIWGARDILGLLADCDPIRGHGFGCRACHCGVEVQAALDAGLNVGFLIVSPTD